MAKSLKKAIKDAKGACEHDRPLLSEIMDCFGSEQDHLIRLAHEHHRDAKRQKRDDDHLAALGKLSKQAAGSSNANAQSSNVEVPYVRPHKQAGALAGQTCK